MSLRDVGRAAGRPREPPVIPPLNEHGSALNAFWLPGDREEGVRYAEVKAYARQTGLTPGPDVTRRHQMGD